MHLEPSYLSLRYVLGLIIIGVGVSAPLLRTAVKRKYLRYRA